MTFICAKDLKEHPDEEYGGYDIYKYKDLCKKHWDELLEIKNKRTKEIEEWWSAIHP